MSEKVAKNVMTGALLKQVRALQEAGHSADDIVKILKGSVPAKYLDDLAFLANAPLKKLSQLSPLSNDTLTPLLVPSQTVSPIAIISSILLLRGLLEEPLVNI